MKFEFDVWGQWDYLTKMNALGWMKSLGNRLVSDQTHHVSDNVVAGNNLEFKDMREICSLLTRKLREMNHPNEYFRGDERLIYIWSFNGSFSPDQNTLVGVTNYRLFKLEDDHDFIQVPLKDLVGVSHIRSQTFATWDKIQCVLTNGSQMTFGIFQSKACEYFCEYLRKAEYKVIEGGELLRHNLGVSPPRWLTRPIAIPVPSSVARGQLDPLQKLYQPAGSPVTFRDELHVSGVKLGESPVMEVGDSCVGRI